MNEERKQLETLAGLYFDPADAEKPYLDAAEQTSDWLKLIDMLCAALLIRRERGEQAHRRGALGAVEDLFLALEASAVAPPISQAVAGFAQVMEGLFLRSGVTLEKTGALLPLHRLTAQLQLRPFELFCTMLAAAADLNRKYELAFSALQDDPSAGKPTLGLAVDLFSMVSPLSDAELYRMCHPETPCNKLIFEPFADKPEASRLSRPLAVNKYILYSLSGAQLPFDELPAYCEFAPAEELGPILAHEREYEQIKALLESHISEPTPDDRLTLLHLHGLSGAGKRFILRRAACALGLDLMLVDCTALLRLPLSELRHQLSRLTAQSILGETLLCLDQFEVARDSEAMAGELLKYLARSLTLIVLISVERLTFALPDRCACHGIAVESTSVAEQRALWHHFIEAGGYQLDAGTDIERLVSSYDLPVGHIKDVLRIAGLEARAEHAQRITRSQMENAIREKSRVALNSLAVLMQTGFTWDDLIISDDSRRLLQKVCDRVLYKRVVNDEWGFNRKLPYGRGLTVLLYGPPGTGKTMAAQVLANEIGRDIYRIELSQMVSKYIGETEKNLGAVFDAARNVNAILFFDEADALFSKRTEIKDSKDKYSNTETSYLLQKIEAHNGITILATNNALNLDVAFKRRINYFISIEMPDLAARLGIWQSIFTASAPLNKGVDLSFFAKKFELSGSEIKSIVLEAAYMAAAQGSEITHELLLTAVQDEYKKNGRVLLEQDRV